MPAPRRRPRLCRAHIDGAVAALLLGVNGKNEQWLSFWVKVYQADVSVEFDTPVGMDVLDAWARPRPSTGLPDSVKIDARFAPSFLDVV
jgi:hypothetical protein